MREKSAVEYIRSLMEEIDHLQKSQGLLEELWMMTCNMGDRSVYGDLAIQIEDHLGWNEGEDE